MVILGYFENLPSLELQHFKRQPNCESGLMLRVWVRLVLLMVLLYYESSGVRNTELMTSGFLVQQWWCTCSCTETNILMRMASASQQTWSCGGGKWENRACRLVGTLQWGKCDGNPDRGCVRLLYAGGVGSEGHQVAAGGSCPCVLQAFRYIWQAICDGKKPKN